MELRDSRRESTAEKVANARLGRLATDRHTRYHAFFDGVEAMEKTHVNVDAAAPRVGQGKPWRPVVTN